MNKDAQIGLWTVVVLLGLFLFSSVRGSGLIDLRREVGLLFTQVHGLRAGDPVTIGGVPKGRVVSIDFAPPEVQESFAPITGGTTLVRAMIVLDGGQRIPKESTYTVRVDLNGTRWLDITFSPSQEMIGPEDNFFAETASAQDDQLRTTIDTFAVLTEQTKELRAQLTAPDFLLRTKDTASNLRFYSREMAVASAQAPDQLAAFEDNLDAQELALLQRIEAFDQKTEEVSRRMVEMGPQLSETLQGWSLRMERQSDRLTSTLVTASEKGSEYQSLLDQAVQENLNPEVTDQLVRQTKKWGRKLQEYRYLAEDLHSLTSDPTIRADLKKAIDDFRLQTESMNLRLLELEQKLKNNPLTGSVSDEEQEEAPEEP